MVLDIEDAGSGRFHVWGVTPEGASVLVRVPDFQPYFFIHAPEPAAAGGGAPSLHQLAQLLNHHIPPDSRIQSVEEEDARPIYYYRPDAPGGQPFLRLTLGVGGNARRAAAAVLKAMTGAEARGVGLSWRDTTIYESEVNPLQRLLADVPLSGGAHVSVAPAGAGGGPPSPGGMGHGTEHGGGFSVVPPSLRVSTSDAEVEAPWRSICCLTPDATQLSDPNWTPFPGGLAGVPPPVQHAAEAARRGDFAPLRLAVMDVLSATSDGAERWVRGGGCPRITCTLNALHPSAY